MPNGTILRRLLENFLRDELIKRGYQEVITPAYRQPQYVSHIGSLSVLFRRKCSRQSIYRRNRARGRIFAQAHELSASSPSLFLQTAQLSRFADSPCRIWLGLSLRAVRRTERTQPCGFTWDDAHIYCTHEQLKDELINAIELTQLVFQDLWYGGKTRLSFRDPNNTENILSTDEMWNQAEREIQEVTDMMGLDYFIGVGEAAFTDPNLTLLSVMLSVANGSLARCRWITSCRNALSLSTQAQTAPSTDL